MKNIFTILALTIGFSMNAQIGFRTAIADGCMQQQVELFYSNGR